MSAGSIGSLGYDDDSGQGPMIDTKVVFDTSSVQSGDLTIPIFDASGFSTLQTVALVATRDCWVRPFFYTDSAKSRFTGGYYYVVGKSNGSVFGATQPVLGPWCEVNIHPLTGAGNYTPTVTGLLTNAPSFRGVTPFGRVQTRSGVSIPASGSSTYAANAYFGGRATVYIEGGTGGVNVKMQLLDGAGVYLTFAQFDVAANAYQLTTDVVWPWNHTQMVVTNKDAASANATWSVQVIPELNE